LKKDDKQEYINKRKKKRATRKNIKRREENMKIKIKNRN